MAISVETIKKSTGNSSWLLPLLVPLPPISLLSGWAGKCSSITLIIIYWPCLVCLPVLPQTAWPSSWVSNRIYRLMWPKPGPGQRRSCTFRISLMAILGIPIIGFTTNNPIYTYITFIAIFLYMALLMGIGINRKQKRKKSHLARDKKTGKPHFLEWGFLFLVIYYIHINIS